MVIEVERGGYQDMTHNAGDEITEELRDLARWLYRQLEREYNHQTSDAIIDEMMNANEDTFTANGMRFG